MGANVNWEAVGAIGEIVGSLAVVLTLAFLSVQIRQGKRATEHNTRAVESASLREVLEGYRDRVNIPMFQNAEYTELYVNGMNSYEALSVTEKRRFYFLIGEQCLHFQNVMQLRHNGLLQEVDFEAWRSFTGSVLATPGGKVVWPMVAATITETVRENLQEYLRTHPDAPSYIELVPLLNNDMQSRVLRRNMGLQLTSRVDGTFVAGPAPRKNTRLGS